MKHKTVGLPPKQRKMAAKQPNKKLTGNQWQNTPQQNMFMEYWLNTRSTTFGNAYESALRAEYSPHYAVKLVANSTQNKWITEYRKQSNLDVNHIKALLQDLATNKEDYQDSKSPADTRIKAIEVLAKILGLTDTKPLINIENISPILGGQTSTERKVIDQT